MLLARAVVASVLLIAVVGFALAYAGNARRRRPFIRVNTPREEPKPPPHTVVPRLQLIDPTFSLPVFLDWANLIFTRFHEARGSRDLDAISPYLSELVARDVRGPESGAVKEIDGLLIGTTRLERVDDGDPIMLDVVFRANWTARLQEGRSESYWVEELWTFSRARGVRSRAPEAVERLGCPSCGSAVERSALGRCAHCGGSTRPGEADWCVARRRMREVERKPPLLTGYVEEVGTDLPTIRQPQVERRFAALPPASQAHFHKRAEHIFKVLQTGWAEGDLELMRPLETDALFSQHRFWLEQYECQGLQNRIENLKLSRVELCKVQQDAFYDAITCRMRASNVDVTISKRDGKVVGGHPTKLRSWTEYWTFIRRRGAKEVGSDVQCPSCTAPLQVTQAGVCAHCGTKLTRGDFDWVLSRIEQDEEYLG